MALGGASFLTFATLRGSTIAAQKSHGTTCITNESAPPLLNSVLGLRLPRGALGGSGSGSGAVAVVAVVLVVVVVAVAVVVVVVVVVVG